MAQIYKSDIKEMNLYKSNDANIVADLTGVKSKIEICHELIYFFLKKRIEVRSDCFDALTEAILGWIKENYGKEIFLLFYISEKVARDDIFMSRLNASINNAFLMAFLHLDYDSTRLVIGDLEKLVVKFLFIESS